MTTSLLADRLEQWFQQHGLTAGGRVPSERELADALHWSRTQVREALDVLQAGGRLQFVSPRVRFLVDGGGPVMLVSNLALDDRQPGTFLHHALRGAAQACTLKRRPWLLAPQATVALAGLGAVGGMIVFSDALVGEALPEGLPAVPTVVQSDDPSIPTDRVVLDQARGAALVLRWLASRGVRRPCRVLRPDVPDYCWMQRRRDGHRQACAALGLIDRELLVARPDHGFDETGFRRNVAILAEQLGPLMRGSEAPDALIAVSDGDVACLAAALRSLSLDPASIPIAGFDGYWAHTPERRWEPTPPAVGIDRCDAAVGAALVGMLLRRLAGELPAEPQLELIQPRLLPGISP